MVSNEPLESEFDDIAETPTAADLGYEDSDLSAVLDPQQDCIEFKPADADASDESWVRTTTSTVVFAVKEWC